MDSADRLVQSTRMLLWERGYVGTSPKAIQAESGVGQGSMYHHFAGKHELALAAIRRTAAEMRAAAEALLTGPGGAVDRVRAYLLREREALRGCPIGRLTQDPDVVADAALRAPVAETFDRVRDLLAGVLAEGRQRGELGPGLDPADTAATVVAVLQGGYVLARAADSPEPYHQAIHGVLRLLDAHVTDPPA